MENNGKLAQFHWWALFRLLLLVAVLGGIVFPATADDPHRHVTPQTAADFTHGVLWKVEGSAKPSYVFGTVHSDDPRVLKLPPAVRQAFSQAASFTMETIASGDGMIAAAQAMFFNDDRTLESVIGQALYKETRAALSARGLSEDIDRKKPWAVMADLSMPKGGKPFLDLVLLAQATREGKAVYGLETMEEQIAVFNDLPLADQTHLLAQAVHEAPDLDRQLETLIKAYLARDLAALAALENSETPADDPVYRAFMDRLVRERNHRMAERMIPRLKEGNAFIAVGALHLPGDEGVLRLLQKAGYRLTPIY